MTPLGVGPEHCREALGRYRQRVALLAGLLSGAPAIGRGSDALVEFDELVSGLEVDSLARRGPAVSERMSVVEAELFAPAVARAYQSLAGLSRQAPTRRWLPALQEVDRGLAEVEGSIERWHRRVGVD